MGFIWFFLIFSGAKWEGIFVQFIVNGFRV
jgi:hypothetical protein